MRVPFHFQYHLFFWPTSRSFFSSWLAILFTFQAHFSLSKIKATICNRNKVCAVHLHIQKCIQFPREEGGIDWLTQSEARHTQWTPALENSVVTQSGLLEVSGPVRPHQPEPDGQKLPRIAGPSLCWKGEEAGLWRRGLFQRQYAPTHKEPWCLVASFCLCAV